MINLIDLPKNLTKPIDDGACDHLLNSIIPIISLPNQDDIFLKLNRSDTFRMVLFCYPMTGHPERPLPKNWNLIYDARGCTIQNCLFRDNYENLVLSNALPVGVSSQSTDDIKEMTIRLKIPYDILSDLQLKLALEINLPTFSINKKIYLKRVTFIIEKSIIKKIFYPIFSPQKHINEVLEWLGKN